MASSSARQGLEITAQAAGEVRGEPVQNYVLSNAAGTEVSVLSYAGIVRSVKFADRVGRSDNVVLGFRTLAEYVRYNPARTAASPEGAGTFFGALIGRYANRIAGGRFRLGGRSCQVPANNGANSLHGGAVGFDQKVWAAKVTRDDGAVGLRLEYTSPAGEMGFPGTLLTAATYTLDNANCLTLVLEATTDAPTVVNLTSHTYWDLAGEQAGTIYGHVLQIDADAYTPVDEALIPTGEIRPVAGTPFDFREPTAIGERIREEDPQLLAAWGYDHNWVLNGGSSGSLRPVATVLDPTSGRALRVHTTQPGLQFYSGNFLNGSLVGSGGRTYRQSDGFALETQHFPDAPNRPEFASTELRPGEKYSETTVFELFCEP